MQVGQRLKELRESKHLSQGDLEKRTGFFRCYTSRVENGHTVPTIETLEKYAAALEVPMYKLFYEGDEPPEKPNLPDDEGEKAMWGTKDSERRELRRFARAFLRLNEHHRRLLLAMAQCIADRRRT